VRSAKILVAEDDRYIRQGLIDSLESEGYQVVPAEDGAEALRLFRTEAPDLVLLDIMMPGRNGYDVCREIRRGDARTPILMLTAKGEEIDKVVGLELGADDYVTKPFGVRELLARIAAVLRRARRGSQGGGGDPRVPARFRLGEAEVDRTRYAGRLGDREFRLTPREMQLLELFFLHPGEVLSRDRLLNAVWGIGYEGTTRTLDQHVAQLRKKIETDPASPRTLVTVHGVGYRLVE
jgi:DNA-binding response OmpR family regulator